MTNDKFHLDIPNKSDYISIARLTTSAICSNMKLSIDEIDDIKVCVGEACNNIISNREVEQIYMDFEMYDDKFLIKVRDVSDIPSQDGFSGHDGELGLLIISSLMDEVKFTDEGIEMFKYIG